MDFKLLPQVSKAMKANFHKRCSINIHEKFEKLYNSHKNAGCVKKRKDWIAIFGENEKEKKGKKSSLGRSYVGITIDNKTNISKPWVINSHKYIYARTKKEFFRPFLSQKKT